MTVQEKIVGAARAVLQPGSNASSSERTAIEAAEAELSALASIEAELAEVTTRLAAIGPQIESVEIKLAEPDAAEADAAENSQLRPDFADVVKLEQERSVLEVRRRVLVRKFAAVEPRISGVLENLQTARRVRGLELEAEFSERWRSRCEELLTMQKEAAGLQFGADCQLSGCLDSKLFEATEFQKPIGSVMPFVVERGSLDPDPMRDPIIRQTAERCLAARQVITRLKMKLAAVKQKRDAESNGGKSR